MNMTLTAENLFQSIQSTLQDLKQDIFSRFSYNLDENITFLDLSRNLILLENVFRDESLRKEDNKQHHMGIIPLQNSRSNIQNSSGMNSGHFVNYSNDMPGIQSKKNSTPFNIQNQADFRDTLVYPRQEVYQSDSSDSIPIFHKQLLKEYKQSMEQLKKQNKIIRAIVQENTPPQAYLKYSKNKQIDSSIDGDDQKKKNKGVRRLFEVEQKLSKESYQEKLSNTPKKSKDSNKEKQILAQDLEELQKLKAKEISKIKQIDLEIHKREMEQDQVPYSSRQEGEKSQKKSGERKYVSKINEQICKLDKEIRHITSYIQDCILKEN